MSEKAVGNVCKLWNNSAAKRTSTIGLGNLGRERVRI